MHSGIQNQNYVTITYFRYVNNRYVRLGSPFEISVRKTSTSLKVPVLPELELDFEFYIRAFRNEPSPLNCIKTNIFFDSLCKSGSRCIEVHGLSVDSHISVAILVSSPLHQEKRLRIVICRKSYCFEIFFKWPEWIIHEDSKICSQWNRNISPSWNGERLHWMDDAAILHLNFTLGEYKHTS